MGSLINVSRYRELNRSCEPTLPTSAYPVAMPIRA
jgi:hypothetical protein